MAIIQNSEVIQKLVDELGLSPALEKVPTELADKILPVFQVNSETISLQAKPKYLLWQDATNNDADKTLTVPDGHTYVVKFGMCKFVSDATVGSRMPHMIISDASGNEIWYVIFAVEQPASKTYYYRISAIDPKSQAGSGTYQINVPIPHELPLKEGYTIRIHDFESIALATDDMHVSFLVDDQED